MALDNIASAARNCQNLLEKFRALKAPTFIVQHLFNTPSAPFFTPNTHGAELHESISPKDQDKMIVKNEVNSFRNTDLLQELQQVAVENVVICGAMSHMCVDAAVRAAADFGFHCILAHDACATCAQEFNGIRVPAEQVHAAYMAALSFAYADVISTAEVLSRLEK